MLLTPDEVAAILGSDKGLTATGEAPDQAPLSDVPGSTALAETENPMSLVHVPAARQRLDTIPRQRVVGYDGHHAGGINRQWERMLNVPRRRMKEARLAAGMTQYDLAVATGLTITGVANIERGRSRYPRLVTMEAVAAALGVDLRWLCDD